MRYFALILFGSFFLATCTAQTPSATLRFGENRHIVQLLDSAGAANAIVFDRRNRYFDLVTPSEMSIQMKQPLQEGQARAALLPSYIDFLRHDVASFSPEELRFVGEVVIKLYKTCHGVAPGIFPDTLKLIKTKGNHYGDGVYYTREKCIVIPANELEAAKTTPFTTTMFHELFHVYSRLNPAKSAKLYKLIGFEGIGLDKLQIPEKLAARLLYNPDGVDFAQKISLTLPDNTKIEAIPVLFSNHLGSKAGQNEFFGYVEFNLYQIVPKGDGGWQLVTKEDGFSSTLSVDKIPDFFRQIKDNTGYIIHPDEVLADNFSFVMMEKNGAKLSQKFSPEGKKLLVDLENVLKEK